MTRQEISTGGPRNSPLHNSPFRNSPFFGMLQFLVFHIGFLQFTIFETLNFSIILLILRIFKLE